MCILFQSMFLTNVKVNNGTQTLYKLKVITDSRVGDLLKIKDLQWSVQRFIDHYIQTVRDFLSLTVGVNEREVNCISLRMRHTHHSISMSAFYMWKDSYTYPLTDYRIKYIALSKCLLSHFSGLELIREH